MNYINNNNIYKLFFMLMKFFKKNVNIQIQKTCTPPTLHNSMIDAYETMKRRKK